MKAVFLDRDGVINELVYHQEAGVIDSPFTVRQFRLLPGVGRAIARLNHAGHLVFVVSNQPGVAKKHFTKTTHMRIDSKLKSDLAADGARIDATYYCLHHPQATNPTYRLECDCRKPEPGLLLRAIQAYRLNAAECFMIGDNLTDIQAGQRAGCRTVLIGRMKCELCNLMDELRVRPDRISGDLPEAANFILDQEGRHGNLH